MGKKLENEMAICDREGVLVGSERLLVTLKC